METADHLQEARKCVAKALWPLVDMTFRRKASRATLVEVVEQLKKAIDHIESIVRPGVK